DLLPIDDPQHLLPLRRAGEVLITPLRNQDVVLDAHPADGVEQHQDVGGNVARVDRAVEEVSLEVLTAEVASARLAVTVSRGLAGIQDEKGEEGTHMPGSIVTTIFFSSLCRPRGAGPAQGRRSFTSSAVTTSLRVLFTPAPASAPFTSSLSGPETSCVSSP